MMQFSYVCNAYPAADSMLIPCPYTLLTPSQEATAKEIGLDESIAKLLAGLEAHRATLEGLVQHINQPDVPSSLEWPSEFGSYSSMPESAKNKIMEFIEVTDPTDYQALMKTYPTAPPNMLL